MKTEPLPGYCKGCGMRVWLIGGVWCEEASGDIQHQCPARRAK